MPEIKLAHQTYTVDSTPAYMLGQAYFYPCSYELDTSSIKGGGSTYARLLAEDPWERQPALLKKSVSQADNDLVVQERAILQQLGIKATGPAEWVSRAVPDLIDSGVHNGLETTVFRVFSGYVDLAHLIRTFPDGLEFRDVSWIWKRFLSILWFAHKEGVIHGAMLPEHMYVHPIDHGPKLIEWGYATSTRGKIKALRAEFVRYYAPEILGRQSVTYCTDLYMLGKTILRLLGGDLDTNAMPKTVPSEFQALVLDCVARDPADRYAMAGDLHEKLDKVMCQLVGKNPYRPLKISV